MSEHWGALASDPVAERLGHFLEERLMFGTRRIAPEESLIESGIVDSTGVLEIVTFIEESFGLRVADHEITPQNLASLAGLVAFVRRKTACR